jgi:hypothetical protein
MLSILLLLLTIQLKQVAVIIIIIIQLSSLFWCAASTAEWPITDTAQTINNVQTQ